VLFCSVSENSSIKLSGNSYSIVSLIFCAMNPQSFIDSFTSSRLVITVSGNIRNSLLCTRFTTPELILKSISLNNKIIFRPTILTFSLRTEVIDCVEVIYEKTTNIIPLLVNVSENSKFLKFQNYPVVFPNELLYILDSKAASFSANLF
jgi:hypothetical protein